VEALGEENVAIDPWPADMSGFVQAKYLFLNANTTGQVADETKWFMAFMLSPEAQGIIAGIDPGFLPVTEGVDFTGTQRLQAVTAMSTGVPFPVIPEMGAYWGPMGTAIQSVLVDGADPAEALQAAFDAVTAAVAEIRAGQ
jgi:maltose-binding protein MalE